MLWTNFLFIEVFYSPTKAQVIFLKTNIKIYIKIAPTLTLRGVIPAVYIRLIGREFYSQ
jgi:energy-converting hydrogenase Eha subunit G